MPCFLMCLQQSCSTKQEEPLQHWARVSVQVTFAAMRKLKTALNFRQWTARGKGLVLLNVLVSNLSSTVRQF